MKKAIGEEHRGRAGAKMSARAERGEDQKINEIDRFHSIDKNIKRSLERDDKTFLLEPLWRGMY